MHEYDLIADWYVRDRTHPAGLPEVQAVAGRLRPGASVLDIGCGNGIPLTKWLVDAGFDVLGVDSSSKMLEKFRTNLPNTPFICSTIQAASLPVNAFDAAISWGMIFHLPHDQQAIAFAQVSLALKPGGQFLFTSGDKGEHDGIEGEPMNGVPFHYWSLTVEGYRTLLRHHGLTVLDVHYDSGQNTYYLAEKVGR